MASYKDLYNGKAEITAMEIMHCVHLGGEQAILSLLKEKGAPITGTFLHEQDPTFEWKAVLAPDRMSQTVSWRKILPAKPETESE